MWVGAANSGTGIGMRSSITLGQSRFLVSRAMSASGRCGQGISDSGCLRGTSLPTDGGQGARSAPALVSELLRKSQESGAWPGPCRGGLPLLPCTWSSSIRTSPPWCPTSRCLVSAWHWRSASDCPRMGQWLGTGRVPSNAQVLAGLRLCVFGCFRRVYCGAIGVRKRVMKWKRVPCIRAWDLLSVR